MSDDLVRRLRQGGTYQHDTVPMLKAADRIEQLTDTIRVAAELIDADCLIEAYEKLISAIGELK